MGEGGCRFSGQHNRNKLKWRKRSEGTKSSCTFPLIICLLSKKEILISTYVIIVISKLFQFTCFTSLRISLSRKNNMTMTMIDFISIFYFILILFTFLVSHSLPSLSLPSLFLFQSHEILSFRVISYFTSRFLLELHILNHHLPYLLRFSVLIFLSFMANIHSFNSSIMQHPCIILA